MTAPFARRPALYDVVQVCAGFVFERRHLESVRLTVTAVWPDGSVDATETTGGERIHLTASQFRLISPTRGAS